MRTLQLTHAAVIRARTAQNACIAVAKSFTYASVVLIFTAQTVKRVRIVFEICVNICKTKFQLILSAQLT